MLPGVSTRGLEFIVPMPPTIVPYIEPPFASAPWQATQRASKIFLPCAAVPRPAGNPCPSGVRMSMFQLARSASLTACPKRGLSGSGCTACGAVLPSGTPAVECTAMGLPFMPAQPRAASATVTAAARSLSLADCIAHLPGLVDRPRLDRVVVLHEADDRARLLQVRDARLHVAVVVHGAAHQHRRPSVPVPADLEAREALVHDRLLDHRLAPVLAAVGGHVDRADLARARPRKPGDLVEARAFQLLP